MYFDIVKGWPSQAAIDEVAKADPGETITEGMIVNLINGTIKSSKKDVLDDGVRGIAWGHEAARGTWTVLLSQLVLAMDSAYYSGQLTAGDELVVSDQEDGKFAKYDKEKDKRPAPVIGRVLSVDANTGIARVLWYPAK